MLKKSVMLAGFLLLNTYSVFAKETVDLYGDNSAIGKRLLVKYQAQIQQVEDQMFHLAISTSPADEKKLMNLILAREKLIEKIKKEGHYSWVDFNTIQYQEKDNSYITYTTVDVVKKNELSRLRFAEKTIRHMPKPDKNSLKPMNDLINQQVKFTELEMNLMMNHEIPMNQTVQCPTYHCVSGFTHPSLKPYLKVFNEGAIKERQLILNTLNHDPSPQRRAAAAFLTAHFTKAQEVIDTLTPHIYDKEGSVRNQVLRVIGATLDKEPHCKLNLTPFFTLLNSPSVLDRNKTLLLLSKVSKTPEGKAAILAHAKNNIVQLLALKQPNNHDTAYSILKDISGKDFGEHNIKAWQDWLALA